MRNVRVIGIGVICAMGNSAQEVWDRLDREQSGSLETGKLNYTSCLLRLKDGELTVIPIWHCFQQSTQ